MTTRRKFLTTAAAGATLEEADALFDARGDSSRNGKTIDEKAANAAAALDMYKELLTTETDTFTRAYIGGQIGRSYVFIGDFILPKDDETTFRGFNRKAWFDDCFSYIDIISPENLGVRTQTWHYTKAACIAFSSELAGLLEKLANSAYFEEGGDQDIMYNGIAIGVEYQGGAILRTLSGVRSNPLAVAIGVGDFNEALDSAQTALDVANSSEYDRNSTIGLDYCDNYRYKAAALIELERTDEALDTLLDAFDYFGVEGDAGDFEVLFPPAGLAIDTEVCVERIFELAADKGLSL